MCRTANQPTKEFKYLGFEVTHSDPNWWLNLFNVLIQEWKGSHLWDKASTPCRTLFSSKKTQVVWIGDERQRYSASFQNNPLALPANFSAKQPSTAVVFRCLAGWQASWQAAAPLKFNISVSFCNASCKRKSEVSSAWDTQFSPSSICYLVESLSLEAFNQRYRCGTEEYGIWHYWW